MKFQYTVWIPSLEKDIFISELTTGQQKELVKSILSPFNYEFVKNVYSLLQEVTGGQVNIDELTLIDKLLILLRLRSISISDKVEYNFKCTKCKKDVKAAIELTPLIREINKFGALADCENVDHYLLFCGLPRVGTELVFEETNTQSVDITTGDYGKYFSELFLQDLALFTRSVSIPVGESYNTINMEDLPYKTRCQIIEKLPSKLTRPAWQRIKALKEKIKIPLISKTCLCGEPLITLPLVIDSPVYSAFLRSLFNENLHTIYQNIYYMTSIMKFSPSYIESMSPGERDMYWAYFNKDQKDKQNKEFDKPVDIEGMGS